jgi:hypothetical protein
MRDAKVADLLDEITLRLRSRRSGTSLAASE